ncbi:MAG: cytochrome c [Bacteroidales bacterium]|nr:cytochrome c [Bacteroidales bacterium]
MKTIKFLTVSLLVVAMGALLVSMTPQRQKTPEPWEVTAKYKNMKNPVAKDDASVKKGMIGYKKYCASCHGKTGLGDGVKSRGLKTFAGDFSIDKYQGQTDGEHFFKTKFGRGEMPKYENKVPDTEIWNIVNYMRTFKK